MEPTVQPTLFPSSRTTSPPSQVVIPDDNINTTPFPTMEPSQQPPALIDGDTSTGTGNDDGGSEPTTTTTTVVTSTDCTKDVLYADRNGDGSLTQDEFVILINLLLNERIAISFEQLPEMLQNLFFDLALQGNAIILDDTLATRRQLNIFRQGPDEFSTTTTTSTRVASGTICNKVSSLINPATQAPTIQPTMNTVINGTLSPSNPDNHDLVLGFNCLESLVFADVDGDGQLSQNEFVVFVNVLGNAQVASTFADLASALQQTFYDYSSSSSSSSSENNNNNNAVVNFETLDITLAPTELPEALAHFCNQTKNEVLQALAMPSGDETTIDESRGSSFSPMPSSSSSTSSTPTADSDGDSLSSPTSAPDSKPSTTTYIPTMLPSSSSASREPTGDVVTVLPDLIDSKRSNNSSKKNVSFTVTLAFGLPTFVWILTGGVL